jgi:predicted porin
MGQYHEYDISVASLKNFLIGVTVPIGAGTIKASYSSSEQDGGNVRPSGDASMLAIGYVYDLSKRTALYAHYAVIDNDTGVRYVVPGGKDRTANNATGFGSQGMEFGIRHSF